MTQIDPLLTIKQACKTLGDGVREKSLRRVAEENGLLIKLGATPMVETSALPKIVELCRVKKPRQGSTSEHREEENRRGTSDMTGVSTLPGAAKAAAANLRQMRKGR